MKKIIKNTLGLFLCLSLLLSSWAQAYCVNFYPIPTLDLMDTGDTAVFPPENIGTRMTVYGASTLIAITPLSKLVSLLPKVITLPLLATLGTMGYFDFKNTSVVFYVPQQGKMAVTIQKDSTREKVELAKAGLEIFSDAYGHHVYPAYPDKDKPLNKEFFKLTQDLKAETDRKNLFISDHDLRLAIREVNETSTVCSKIKKVVNTEHENFSVQETRSFDYNDIVREIISVAIKKAQKQ